MHATLPLLAATDFPPIRRRTLDTLQVNLGYQCNQSCLHCHVAASPQRTEMMDDATVAQVIEVNSLVSVVDLVRAGAVISTQVIDNGIYVPFRVTLEKEDADCTVRR